MPIETELSVMMRAALTALQSERGRKGGQSKSPKKLAALDRSRARLAAKRKAGK